MQNVYSEESNPYLLFEFADRKGEVKPYCFENPIRIIMANRIEAILACFNQVQEAIDAGFYAAGYVSYEAAPAFDASFQVRIGSKMPLLWFGIYKEPTIPTFTNKNEFFNVAEWKPTIYGKEYHSGISKIKKAIEDGDTYQVNYTTRLRSHFTGDDFAFYQQLSKAQASKYSAYLNIGDHRILSASPELFFRWDGEEVMTKPMKGTVKRGKTLVDDKVNEDWLFHSEKNRAENLMIVDLLRNDLGNIAIPGTVKVDKLFELERYPTVWQMTSTITAKTEPNVKIVDLFSALFPCGSITGAPKISTMELISELEDSPRGVYCGAIGFITPKSEAVFNVPIRTVVINTKTSEAEYGVGGGITWDSTTDDEYEEILTKASLLTVNIPPFQLLESLKLENGQYHLMKRHIKRLNQSAEYFGFKIDVKRIVKILDDFAKHHQEGIYKVRLLVSQVGCVSISGELIKPFENPLFITLAKSSVSKNNVFLYHKTTIRNVYDKNKMNHPDFFDVLLWNEDSEITEFTNGNIVVKMDNKRWTPPVSCGLLAGTFRGELLENGEINERILTLDDLKVCSEIWLINSVRGWVKVTLTE